MIEEQRQSGVAYLTRKRLRAHESEELDEVWSFVGTKKNKIWIWIALCRRTRQVVAWWYGSRDTLSCQILWDKIPPDYKTGLCYTNFYATYKSVVPQHQPSAKKENVL